MSADDSGRPISLTELATRLDARLEGDGETVVHAVRPLLGAGSGDITYLDPERDLKSGVRLSATALIVHHDGDRARFPDVPNLLRVANPRLAFARAIELIYPAPEPPPPGVSEEADVHPTARVAGTVHIAAGCRVGPDVRIGAGATLLPGVVVGAACRIGEGCLLHPRVVLYPGCELGERCVIHAGAVIGGDGFGYAATESGAEKIPHRGRAILEADVEVGANTTIDRGVVGDTRIGRGTKIDNLVQIAHNCEIGTHCFISSQVGLAGSTVIGHGVQVGGQVGFAGHQTIGDGAMLAAKSGVHGDVEDGEKLLGYPALRLPHARRVFATLARLPELREEFLRFKQSVEALQKLAEQYLGPQGPRGTDRPGTADGYDEEYGG